MRVFIALALVWAGPVLADMAYVGTFVWDRAEPTFGGFSGIELDDGGTDLWTLSDRGTLYRGQVVRDDDGRIVAITASAAPLTDETGEPLAPDWTDAEGLARAPDGSLFVSFEGEHRVWRYPPGSNRAEGIAGAAAFDRMQPNSSLEALALDASGRLYTLPERSGRHDRPFPVFRLDAGGWVQPFDIPRVGPFLPVGADIGPDSIGRF